MWPIFLHTQGSLCLKRIRVIGARPQSPETNPIKHEQTSWKTYKKASYPTRINFSDFAYYWTYSV